MTRPLITLLTDFGTAEHYVAVMKGVILGICPEATLVDITHEIPPFSVAEGAFTLAQAWQAFPPGTIHVAVVDPAVGSARRALIAQVGGHTFIGPDNGLFSMVLGGGTARVHELVASQYFRQPVSPTFHGRDVFAPIAAQVARGVAVESLGPRVHDWIRLPGADEGPLTAMVVKVDRFGNLITNFGGERRPIEIIVGHHTITLMSEHYAESRPGELFAIPGSCGTLEISINKGNAATVTGARPGDRIQLRFE